MTEPLLSVHDLRTYFHTHTGVAPAVVGVSSDLAPNAPVGVVGQSGCERAVPTQVKAGPGKAGRGGPPAGR